MSKQSSSAFEKFTGIEIGDLVGNSEPAGDDAGEKRIAQIDLNDLRVFLEEEEQRKRPHVYNPGELVPRLWPIRRYDPDGGYPLTPNIVHPGAVCSALLYAHKVEIPDPLLSALRSDCPRYSRPSQVVQSALWVLYKLGPLIEKGIVVVGLGAERESSDFAADFVNAALRKARGRAAYVELLKVPGDTAAELIGSDADSERITAARIKAIDEWNMSDIFEAMLAGIRHIEIHEMLASALRSHADMWLPYPELLGMMAAAHHEATNSIDPVLTWTAGVPSVSLEGLDIRDQISIRLNSGAFEGWRRALHASYKDLQARATLGTLGDAGNSAAEVLRETAEDTLRQLRRDTRIWKGGIRDLTVGLVAAAPAAATASSELAVVTGVSGAMASATAGAAWDLIGASRNRRAVGALRRHTATLSDEIRMSGERNRPIP